MAAHTSTCRGSGDITGPSVGGLVILLFCLPEPSDV